MLRFLWWLIALPVGILGVALAVANRRPIPLALDPFAPDPFSAAALIPPISVPGYLVVLGSLALGVLAGGLAMWLSEGPTRRGLRHWRSEARRLEREAAARDSAAREPMPTLTRLPASDRRVA